jgi:hypothetical protein
MFETIEEAFVAIVEQRGKEIFSANTHNLVGLLSDYAPTLTAERRLVKVAMECGAYNAIAQAEEKDIDKLVNKYASIMQRNYFIEEKAARKSLMWCTKALGYVGKNVEGSNIYVIEEANNTAVINTDDEADFVIRGKCLLKYNGDKSIVQIPDGVDSIGAVVFRYRNNIRKVIFPSTVKDIGFGAFYGCSNMEEVVFSEGLIKIGYMAFGACSLLKEINLPDSLLFIEENAFFNCSNLKRVRIPIGISKIKRGTFNKCSSLEKIIISNRTFISHKAFDKTPQIEYYDSGIEQKFISANNNALNSDFVVIGNGLIGYRGKYKIVHIPDGIDYIGNGTFSHVDINEVVMPNSVTEIGVYAFINCKNLEQITFSERLKYIDRGSFWGCSLLKEINLPDSLVEIDGSAFMGCTRLKTIKIPFGVVKIKKHTFLQCDSLEKIIISRNTIIDKEAFGKDGKIPTIEYYDDINTNVIDKKQLADFDIKGNVLVKYKGNNDIVHIPDGVVEIGEQKFPFSYRMNKVTIPSSVKRLGLFAFSECTDLETVVFSEGLENIGYGAFRGCRQLTDIQLPDSLKTIDCEAFSGCTLLRTIKIPAGVSKIGRNTFKHCNHLEKIIVSRNTVILKNAFDEDKIPTIEYYESKHRSKI